VDAVSDAETSLPPSVGVLVGIPAYDEAGTIADVVARADDHADHVLVVDDGSTDDTVERAEAAGAHVLRHETNTGYGAALKTIFEEAHRRNVDHLVVLDADAQHDPEDVRQLLGEQERTGANIVIGSRFLGSSQSELPVYRRVGLGVINAMTNLSLANLTPDSWIHDTQSGFRAYDGRTVGILAESDDLGNGMDASTDILHTAYRNDCDVREVETTIRYDVDNANSYNPVFHGLMLVSNLLRTVEREHPILLLGVPVQCPESDPRPRAVVAPDRSEHLLDRLLTPGPRRRRELGYAATRRSRLTPSSGSRPRRSRQSPGLLQTVR